MSDFESSAVAQPFKLPVSTEVTPVETVAEIDFPQTPETEVVQAEAATEQRRGGVRSWLAKHRGWLIGGGMVASAALAFTPNSASETIDGLKEVTPWVVPGMIAAEAAWIGGAAMVVSSAGKTNLKNAIKHPMQTKSQFADIARGATNTTAFKAGFWVNTTGAVAEFVIPAAAVVTHLPPESWGILTLSTADLALTIATRKAILTAARENNAQPTD